MLLQIIFQNICYWKHKIKTFKWTIIWFLKHMFIKIKNQNFQKFKIIILEQKFLILKSIIEIYHTIRKQNFHIFKESWKIEKVNLLSK